MTTQSQSLLRSDKSARQTLRTVCLILAALVFLLFAHGVFFTLNGRLVASSLGSTSEAHARHQDIGGILLAAWHLPATVVMTALLFVLFRRASFQVPLRRWLAAPPTRVLVIAVALSFLATLLWFGFALRGNLVGEDDQAYLFEAGLLAQKHVALIAPWDGFTQAFSWPWSVAHQGRVFSFQMPGHCLFLALGVLLGAPWMIPVVQGVIMAIATHFAARRAFGRRTATLSSLLLATSPYFLTTQSSYGAPTSGAMGVALILLAAVHFQKMPTPWRAILLGSSIALLWLVRPPTAAMCALPIGLAMLARILRSELSWRYLLLVVAVAVVGLAPYFLYCRATSGTWAFSPGAVYSDRVVSGELSIRNAFSSKGHPLITAVPNTITSIVRLNCYLFGWPFSLLPIAVLLWRRKWRGWNGQFLSICGLLFAFYAMSQKILGWYYYELMPCMAILGARGLVELRRWMRECTPVVSHAGERMNAFVVASCLTACVLTVPATLYRQALYVDDWNQAVVWVNAQISEGRAIVFVDIVNTDGATSQAMLGSNDLALDNRVIFARFDQNREGEQERVRLTRRHYPGREVYLYRRDRFNGAHSVEPFPPPRAMTDTP